MNFQDVLQAFVANLQNWRRRVESGNVSMFDKLDSTAGETEGGLNETLQKDICEHLESLMEEFQHYFPDTEQVEFDLVRNPFSRALAVGDIPDELQDEFLELSNGSSARDVFNEKSLAQFWCDMRRTYTRVSTFALRNLLPFASTYLCETGFSTLVNIKTKSRNRLDVQSDMRLALTATTPRIGMLVSNMQPQSSH